MRLFLVIVVVGLASRICFADLLADFKRDYPVALAKLDKVYSQVRMRGTVVTTTREGEPGETVEQVDFEAWRNGELLRQVKTIVKDPEKRLVGYVTIDGGGPEFSYFCWRMGGSKKFVFGQYGKDETQQYAWESTRVFMPMRMGYRTIPEMLQDKGRNLVGVRGAQFDGREAVEVTANFRGLVVQRFYFDSGSWVRLGSAFEWPNVPNATMNEVIRYDWSDESGIPRLKSAEIIGESANGRTHTRVEVRKLEFVEVPAKDFSAEGLKGLGVTELPQGNVPAETQAK